MSPNPKIMFGIYCFLPSDCCLKMGAKRLPLLPKDAAVLNCLLAKKGHLVTKNELLKDAWSGTVVSTSVIRSSVKRLRKVLDDTYDTPRYIETVHGKGYRFVCEVKEPPLTESTTTDSRMSVLLSGRKTELDHLGQLFKETKEGRRRIAFVSGEAGIGKTTLVKGFVSDLFGSEEIGLARGNCVDQYGSEEEYLPFLEALNQLCRVLSGDRMTSLLYKYAPMWLAQIPWLLNNDEREKLQNTLIGTTPQRMLRELAEFLEVLSQDLPLVLVLEDLHWSDTATVAAIDYLARRRNRAKIMLLGTYRPLEVNYRQHPLGKTVAELKLHGDVTEFSLAPLSENALKTYLNHAFDGLNPPEELIQWINHYGRGNPLFWRSLITQAQNRGWLKKADNQLLWQTPSKDSTDRLVPDNLMGSIQHQIEQISAENRSLLERASIMGATFHTAALTDEDTVAQEHSETGYNRIAQHEQLIKPVLQDSFPDAIPTRSYAFVHILYQRVIYEGIATLRRRRLHLEIGKRLEAIYGERTHEIAGALAMHFDRGGEALKASTYRQQAAEISLGRLAYKEAINHATSGLRQIDTLPDNPEKNSRKSG